MTLADEVGAALAKRGATVVYGGGGVGLMGAVAGAALREGGQVVGVIPHALTRQESAKVEVTNSSTEKPTEKAAFRINQETRPPNFG